MEVLHQFLALVNGNAKDEQLLEIVDVDVEVAPGADPDLLPLPAPAESISRVHSVAHHVLQGVSAEHCDISRKILSRRDHSQLRQLRACQWESTRLC